MEPASQQLIAQFKSLGDATRLRLVLLCAEGECSVSELTEVVGQSQPRVSQQLKQLCEAGLLERFRDGKRVFYRLQGASQLRSLATTLLQLIPENDPVLNADRKSLRRLLRQTRGQDVDVALADGTVLQSSRQDDSADRALHRLLFELTVTAPVGDLLDIGCGRGAILKLLAARANRAVGVDIDTNARQLARAELMLAGLPNCSLRKGDMHRLPFADDEFNTIIIDDVLIDARRPIAALKEASRVMRKGGRLFILESVLKRPVAGIQESLANWCKESGLRLSPARLAPKRTPAWVVCVASASDDADAEKRETNSLHSTATRSDRS